jgi:heme-degrading monooxygenase HmoA
MATISRHIIVKAPAGKEAEIERLWKQDCAPLMIKRPGCLREELLKCREDKGEFISISEWESQKAIDDYLKSPEHEQIKAHTRGLTGVAATVKSYELVGG